MKEADRYALVIVETGEPLMVGSLGLAQTVQEALSFLGVPLTMVESDLEPFVCGPVQVEQVTTLAVRHRSISRSAPCAWEV